MSHGMDEFNAYKFYNKKLKDKPTFDWGVDIINMESIRYREPQSKRPQIIRPRVRVDIIDTLQLLKNITYENYLSHLENFRQMTPEQMRYIKYGGQLHNVAKATFIETIVMLNNILKKQIQDGKYKSSIEERERREREYNQKDIIDDF